ncbi:MAG: thioesterase family protein [Gordonia sp. (in: high G+C Gram-positive bacteria)]
MPNQFSELFDFHTVEIGAGDAIVYRTTISGTFTIGPKVHGGSLQMVVTHAARRALHSLSDPEAGVADDIAAVVVSSDFRNAPDPAEVEVSVQIVKRGRTVSLAHVDVTQGGRVMVSSAVTLARPDHGEPRYRAPLSVDAMPAEPDDDAMWTEHSPMADVVHLWHAADLALDPASLPALRGETGVPEIRGWMRRREAPAGPDVDFPVLVCDMSPPVVMNLGLFGWAPTVQLTTYLHRQPASGWLRFAASSTQIGQGMFAEDHVVVDSAGALVAQSRQLALIPAGR